MIVAITGGPPTTGHPRRQRAFAVLGEASRQLGLGLIVTAPDGFDWRSGRIDGWVYASGGTWRYRTVPWCPMVVFDAMYLADLQACRGSYRRMASFLRRSRIPFFNPVLPAKHVVYRWLGGSEDTPWLPWTIVSVTPTSLLRALEQHPRLWLKPSYGSGGRNMALVERLGAGRYRVVAERFYGQSIHREMGTMALVRLLKQARRARNYMMQEDLPLIRTADGRKVDFRVTVQRDETGRWSVTAMTARMGAPGSVLTNYHAGGEVLSLTPDTPASHRWLQEMGLTDVQLAPVQHLAWTAAEKLTSRLPRLGVLGIDIGLATDGRVYVYDCNSRPGRDILTAAEADAFMRKVAGFAWYLWQRRQAFGAQRASTDVQHPDEPGPFSLAGAFDASDDGVAPVELDGTDEGAV